MNSQVESLTNKQIQMDISRENDSQRLEDIEEIWEECKKRWSNWNIKRKR
jgi:hypothetical protein